MKTPEAGVDRPGAQESETLRKPSGTRLAKARRYFFPVGIDVAAYVDDMEALLSNRPHHLGSGGRPIHQKTSSLRLRCPLDISFPRTVSFFYCKRGGGVSRRERDIMSLGISWKHVSSFVEEHCLTVVKREREGRPRPSVGASARRACHNARSYQSHHLKDDVYRGVDALLSR